MGRTRRVIVPGGVPEIGWLCANRAGRGRDSEIFTRRNNCSGAVLVQTTTIGAAPHRYGRKPAFAVGRHCEFYNCGVVSGWQARAAGSVEGRRTVANLRDGLAGWKAARTRSCRFYG